VRLDAAPEEWPAARRGIDHCLSSLGFRNVSAEDLYPKFMEEDRRIVAVWKPTAEGSFFYVPPFSVAWVLEEEGELYVHFQPSNSEGGDAKFLAHTFSQCTQFHDPNVEVEITSSKIILDLR
jgi:hypothetical protein